jgi:hypothetical protein
VRIWFVAAAQEVKDIASPEDLARALGIKLPGDISTVENLESLVGNRSDTIAMQEQLERALRMGE